MYRHGLIIVSFIAAVFIVIAVASAKLCDKCKDRMVTADIGRCGECGKHTSSGAYHLCPTCSDKTGKCELCLKDMKPAPAPAPEKPKPEKPPTTQPTTKPSAKPADYSYVPVSIIYDNPGTYKDSNLWEYEYVKTDKGPGKVVKYGILKHNGKELPAANVGDYYYTPWGLIEYVGEKKDMPNIKYGWLPTEKKSNGKALITPLAKERAEIIKANLDTFVFQIRYNAGVAEKQSEKIRYKSATLSVSPINFDEADPDWPCITITKEQAETLVDILAFEGFLSQAFDAANKDWAPPENSYVMQLCYTENDTKKPHEYCMVLSAGTGDSYLHLKALAETQTDENIKKAIMQIADGIKLKLE